jgi:hypothetical protein
MTPEQVYAFKNVKIGDLFFRFEPGLVWEFTVTSISPSTLTLNNGITLSKMTGQRPGRRIDRVRFYPATPMVVRRAELVRRKGETKILLP